MGNEICDIIQTSVTQILKMPRKKPEKYMAVFIIVTHIDAIYHLTLFLKFENSLHHVFHSMIEKSSYFEPLQSWTFPSG